MSVATEPKSMEAPVLESGNYGYIGGVGGRDSSPIYGPIYADIWGLYGRAPTQAPPYRNARNRADGPPTLTEELDRGSVVPLDIAGPLMLSSESPLWAECCA